MVATKISELKWDGHTSRDIRRLLSLEAEK